MHPRSKLSLIAVLTILIGSCGWYQVRQRHRQAVEIAELAKRTAEQRLQIQRLRAARDEMAARAQEAPPTPSFAFMTGDTAFDARMESTLARVNQLQKWLNDHPSEKLPEFEYLGDSDWIEAASDHNDFEVRNAARDLRFKARANLATLLRGALKSYTDANAGSLPTDFAQLAPFFVSPIPDAILQRYELRASGPVKAVPVDLPIISEKGAAVAGSSDRPFVIFPNYGFGFDRLGFERDSFLDVHELSPELTLAVSKANQAFRMAHDWARPHDVAQLVPYFENTREAAEFAENQSAKEAISKAIDEGLQGYAAANAGRKPLNREDILPFVRDSRARAILAAKDSYLKDHGEHADDSAALRPYVKDPAARDLLEKVIRAESGRRTP